MSEYIERRRLPVVRVEDHPGIGILIEENAHFGMVQFNEMGHIWSIAVPNDEYDILWYIVEEHRTMEG